MKEKQYNLIYLFKNNFFYFALAFINIFGVLFLDWDIFLIVYISWVEFLILGIFIIINILRYVVLHFLNRGDYIYSYKSIFLGILFFCFTHIIMTFFYGVFLVILFKIQEVSNLEPSFINLITYTIKFINIVWPSVLFIIFYNLYDFLFKEKKSYSNKLDSKYGFKIFVHHFLLMFVGFLLARFYILGLKIVVILFILLQLSYNLNFKNRSNIKRGKDFKDILNQ